MLEAENLLHFEHLTHHGMVSYIKFHILFDINQS